MNINGNDVEALSLLQKSKFGEVAEIIRQASPNRDCVGLTVHVSEEEKMEYRRHFGKFKTAFVFLLRRAVQKVNMEIGFEVLRRKDGTFETVAAHLEPAPMYWFVESEPVDEQH